jgi:hypothetical protein
MALDWTVETLRVSLFSSDTVKLSEDHWRSLTSQDESEGRQTTAAVRAYTGTFLDAHLTLTATGNRLDAILGPIPPSELTGLKLPSIGPWEQTFDAFGGPVANWLVTLDFPIVRVAFGAIIFSPSSDRTTAYEQLKRLLKSVQVDPVNMRELLFRVNWPLASQTVPGVSINRITNWSAVQIIFNIFQVAPARTIISPSADILNAVRLEIDHSTDVDRSQPFDAHQLVAIYRELMCLASANATAGERP